MINLIVWVIVVVSGLTFASAATNNPQAKTTVDLSLVASDYS